MRNYMYRSFARCFAAFVLLASFVAGQGGLFAALTPGFEIAPGQWHNVTAPSIAIVSVGLDSVIWNDGIQKAADLVYTSSTGGTASGDYNGTFNFTVKNGIAWKISFGNGSTWVAGAGEPLDFVIASGAWTNVTDPSIAIESVAIYSVGWNDGLQKGANLSYNSATGGTTSGDYYGTFNFTVSNGIAWKITFGNGSYWTANSGEPTPAAHAPVVEILTPGKNDKEPAGEVLTFTLKITDADAGDSVKKIELYQGRKLVATETSPSATSISVTPKGRGRENFTVKVFDQGGRFGSDSVKVRLQR